MSLSSLSSLSDMEDMPARRHIPDRINIFDKYDGEDFKTKYRVSKKTILQLNTILNLDPMTKRNKPIDGLTQILICLRFFATGSYQHLLGDDSNIHKSTVCRIIQKVTKEIAKLAPVYIQMPQGDELRQVAEDFHSIAGFPRVVGVLDCTRVKINSRSALSEEYRCSEGYSSINVQAVCDAHLKIRNIIAQPGSIHEATIFDCSQLCADFESGKYGHGYLLGHSGYYNKNYLLTPFQRPQSNAEAAYNRSHIATCSAVRRCFSVWKRRCPCLEKGFTLHKTSTVLQTIIASAVLHNMCIELDELEPPNDFNVVGDSEENFPPISSMGNDEESVRTALVHNLFS